MQCLGKVSPFLVNEVPLVVVFHSIIPPQAAFEGGKWAIGSGAALEGAPRFRPKVVLMSLSSIPIEIPILWPRAVMVGPRPRVLLTPPLDPTVPVS
jgi:hypothetical protein